MVTTWIALQIWNSEPHDDSHGPNLWRKADKVMSVNWSINE